LPSSAVLIAIIWCFSGAYTLVIVVAVAWLCVEAGPQYAEAIKVPAFFETFGTLGLGFFIGQLRVVVRMVQTKQSLLGRWTQTYIWTGFACLLLIAAAVVGAHIALTLYSGPKTAAEIKIPSVFMTWGITVVGFVFGQFYDLIFPSATATPAQSTLGSDT
jgi:hypothetical protein